MTLLLKWLRKWLRLKAQSESMPLLNCHPVVHIDIQGAHHVFSQASL
jgi:hypothetical protein